VTGKRADMLRDASGQISAKSHEPLWRKCPYKEIVPEILARTPKSAGKNIKNSAITSFHGELWQQGVTSSFFHDLTDVWPDPIFMPKVAMA